MSVMNVITYACGHLLYSDTSTVMSKLNKRFAFENVVSVESNLQLSKYGQQWEEDWQNGSLTLINYQKEVFRFQLRGHGLSDMPPLSRALLEKLSLERCHLYNMHRDERLTFRELDMEVQNCFRYWNYILDKFSINLFICHGFPHSVYTYSLYALCKARNIKVYYLARSCVPGYIYCHDDLYTNYDRLENAYKSALKNDEPLEFSEYMQSAYIEKMETDSYKFAKITKEKGIGPKEPRKISDFFRLDNWKSYFRYKKEAGDEKRIPRLTEEYYKKISTPADYSKRFIYVPLQQQPESTTSPMGNVYVDFYYMVSTLSHSVKGTDILLYVKEHKDQRRVLRRSRCKLYDDLRAIDNVRLISMDESTYKLQENCIVSATCSGTVVMESLFKYKPVLVFGNRLHNLAPSAMVVDSVDSCKAAVDDILAGRFSFGKKERDAFLYAVERSCFRGFWFVVYSDLFGISHDEAAENVYNELAGRIEEFIS